MAVEKNEMTNHIHTSFELSSQQSFPFGCRFELQNKLIPKSIKHSYLEHAYVHVRINIISWSIQQDLFFACRYKSFCLCDWYLIYCFQQMKLAVFQFHKIHWYFQQNKTRVTNNTAQIGIHPFKKHRALHARYIGNESGNSVSRISKSLTTYRNVRGKMWLFMISLWYYHDTNTMIYTSLKCTPRWIIVNDLK